MLQKDHQVESGALGLLILTPPQAVCMTEGIKSHLIES